MNRAIRMAGACLGIWAGVGAAWPGLAAESREEGYGGWAEPEASHRLELTCANAQGNQYVDLRHLHLPAALNGGVAVRDDDGGVLPYHFLFREKVLFTGPPAPSGRIHVYFGFPGGRRANSTWDRARLGEPPAPHRLLLTTTQAWMTDEKEQEIAKDRNYQGFLQERLSTMTCFPEAEVVARWQAELADCASRRAALEAGSSDGPAAAGEGRRRELAEREQVAQEGLAAARRRLGEKEEEAGRQAAAAAAREREQLIRHEREIEKFFTRDEGGSPAGAKEARRLLLTEGPAGGQKNFAARFTGRLQARRAGRHVFAINSRNRSHLVVDGQMVVSWPYSHPRSADWEKTGEIELAAGPHDFAFYYQTNELPAYAAAAWREPEERHFRLLTEGDFCPAGETRLADCVNAAGQSFPVVRAEPRGWFLLANEARAGWIECAVLPYPWEHSFAWQADGQALATAAKATLALPLGEDRTVRFTLAPGDEGFAEVPLTMRLDTHERFRHDPDLDMTLWTPSFIYDDERLQMEVELKSDLAENCLVRLRTEPDRPSAVFPRREQWLELQGRDEYAMTVHSPSHVWKGQVMLAGKDLAGGVVVTYTMDLPPLVLRQATLRFVPLPSLPGTLRETPYGLADADGRRIIPVLHRLTLAEKRAWAFSKAVAGELAPCRKVLIIADDFTGAGMALSAQLRQRLTGRRVELTFLAWPEAPVGGTVVRAGLAEMLGTLRRAEADRVLIVPPAVDLVEGVPVRLQKRALAAMVETCHRNPRIRTLVLGTPLPCRRDNALEPELVRAVYELVAEYGTGSLDLNRWLRTRPGWESAYRRDLASASVYEPHPVQVSGEIADHLVESLF